MKIDKYSIKKKWGSFDLSGMDLDKNIIELLIDFSLVNNRFRVGQYFEINASGEEQFFNLSDIYSIYKNAPYFGENDPYTVDVVQAIHVFIENNVPILIEYDSRIINRFNKFINVFNPAITKVYLNKLAIKRIKGTLDDFEIFFEQNNIRFLWNTLIIETLLHTEDDSEEDDEE